MELQDVIVLVITIEELDPSSKPCYVIERGAQGGSYKRIDDAPGNARCAGQTNEAGAPKYP